MQPQAAPASARRGTKLHPLFRYVTSHTVSFSVTRLHIRFYNSISLRSLHLVFFLDVYLSLHIYKKVAAPIPKKMRKSFLTVCLLLNLLTLKGIESFVGLSNNFLIRRSCVYSPHRTFSVSSAEKRVLKSSFEISKMRQDLPDLVMTAPFVPPIGVLSTYKSLANKMFGLSVLPVSQVHKDESAQFFGTKLKSDLYGIALGVLVLYGQARDQNSSPWIIRFRLSIGLPGRINPCIQGCRGMTIHCVLTAWSPWKGRLGAINYPSP